MIAIQKCLLPEGKKLNESHETVEKDATELLPKDTVVTASTKCPTCISSTSATGVATRPGYLQSAYESLSRNDTATIAIRLVISRELAQQILY